MHAIEITQPAQEQIRDLDIAKWGPWECEPSQFEWAYDKEEWCFMFEGRACIRPEKGKEVEIKKGDLVKFPKGLRCTWHVYEKVRKVYVFR
jgi:uncharacterized protein